MHEDDSWPFADDGRVDWDAVYRGRGRCFRQYANDVQGYAEFSYQDKFRAYETEIRVCLWSIDFAQSSAYSFRYSN